MAIDLNATSYNSIHEASLKTGLSWNYLKTVQNCCKKQNFKEKKSGKKAIGSKTTEAVKGFYGEDVISFVVGGVRGVTKKGVQIRYMRVTTDEAYRNFIAKMEESWASVLFES